ncbi:sigma-70 family RNA polymerase sigma factor [Heliophilum fasciatum]|uniref:RNA polymerase sigma factor n=1 Tax=Heliophilum fasciatum TaxID=35700 RepID=A0A4R2RQ29_9FIRM|nr:sigma-70 family RNA polymerase sigma factor [Heliophilum fasciatum]MCW2277455.1 RNA polymerase sigma-70 factor (ECF subfamily) [Heliophilum fasciatum]TCP65254.1 RNA polymerase RpoE-like sigma-24 subunit [Heliophilum fasciatum]
MEDVRVLVQQAQQGNTAAFEQLVVRYQHQVYALSYSLAGNYADAQDLAQETFVKAYGALGSFRLEADFGTWLHRIAVNTWINMQRKMKRTSALSLDEPLTLGSGEVQRELAATAENPEEILESKEFQSTVRHALMQLSEEHRAVLVLREVQGYSYEEVAQILDCTLGTVKSRINRARQALKEKLSAVSPTELLRKARR